MTQYSLGLYEKAMPEGLSFREMLDLTVGDVVRLDTRLDDELSVIIGQHQKFKCKPGSSNNRIAVQITQAVAEEEDGHE